MLEIQQKHDEQTNKHDISKWVFVKFKESLCWRKNNQQMNDLKWECKNSTLHLTVRDSVGVVLHSLLRGT